MRTIAHCHRVAGFPGKFLKMFFTTFLENTNICQNIKAAQQLPKNKQVIFTYDQSLWKYALSFLMEDRTYCNEYSKQSSLYSRALLAETP